MNVYTYIYNIFYYAFEHTHAHKHAHAILILEHRCFFHGDSQCYVIFRNIWR